MESLQQPTPQHPTARSRRSDSPTAAGTNSDAVIEIDGIGHTYKGGVTALSQVDLSVGTGLFGLLGPNGAGKSTLMRILCTLTVPTAGRASILGFDVVEERLAVRQRIGYLPQEFSAWRLQRVEEALDSLALLSGVGGRAERRRRVAETLAQVGLSEVARRKVKKLSGGMVRRLGVAQALIHQPPVLIVDEPTVGLDPEERIRFRQLMADLGRDRTIILSTHIVADLGSGCRDLALLDGGELVFRGAPDELVEAARGQIFELVGGGEDEVRLVEAGCDIVSRRGSTVRAVAPSRELPAGARAVETPTLEEAYVAFMLARGQRVAEEIAAGEQAAAGTEVAR